MKPVTITQGLLRLCCATPSNLRQAERRPDGTLVLQCRQCGRRHYRMQADPGALGLTGQPIMGEK